MSLFIGMILFSTFMSNFNPQASRSYNIQHEQTSAKRFAQLLRALDSSDEYEHLFHKTRVPAAEGDCVGNLIQNVQWSGKQSMGIPGVLSSQICMDNCDIRKDCVGWTYNSDNKMCWGFSSIQGVIPVNNDLSGACVGKSLKQPCTDVKSGQYALSLIQTSTDIDTVEDCQKKCDELEMCFVWVYAKQEKKCRLGRSFGTYYAGDYFQTGLCMAPQVRIRMPEPVTLFRKQALERHNFVRKLHCAPNLVLDDALNQEAQALATQLAKADVTPPVYNEPTLRNVFYDKGDEARSGASIVDCFYSEKKVFKWNSPDLSTTDSFVKLIWKGSKKLGVGRAFSADKQTMYITMLYDWKGNVAQALRSNIQETCSK